MKSNHQFQTTQGPKIIKTSAIVGVSPTTKGSRLTLQNGAVVDVSESYADLCELLECGAPLPMPERTRAEGAPKRPQDSAQMNAPKNRPPTELEIAAGMNRAPVTTPDAKPKNPDDSAQMKAAADDEAAKLATEKAAVDEKTEQEKSFFGGKKHK